MAAGREADLGLRAKHDGEKCRLIGLGEDRRELLGGDVISRAAGVSSR